MLSLSFLVISISIICSFVTTNSSSHLECIDATNTDWCGISRPVKSYFRFSNAPMDAERWHRAQIQAAQGEQVLLKKILEQFPFYLNFLDGDILFRNLHQVVDIFIDDNTGFFPLTVSKVSKKKVVSYEFENDSFSFPNPYNSAKWNRATIAMLGYHAFTKEGEKFFSGKEVGSVYIFTPGFAKMWKQLNTSQIENPFILIHANNENYGMLSTFLPNRTANWGLCCTDGEYAVLNNVLNHKKALMYLSSQHSNFTHPKLITLPRGIHLVTDVPKDINRKLIWDTMRNMANTPKRQFAFSATSNAFYRVQIMKCIMKK